MRALAIAATVAAAALAACSGSDAQPPTYSCDQSAVETIRSCVEHGPLEGYGLDYSQGYCTSNGGTWGTAACPTAGRIASCKMGESMGYGTQYFYAGFTGDLADVERQCTMYGGSWATYAP